MPNVLSAPSIPIHPGTGTGGLTLEQLKRVDAAYVALGHPAKANAKAWRLALGLDESTAYTGFNSTSRELGTTTGPNPFAFPSLLEQSPLIGIVQRKLARSF